MMLICHAGPNIESAFEEILKNMRDSAKIRADAEISVRRILRYKKKFLPGW